MSVDNRYLQLEKNLVSIIISADFPRKKIKQMSHFCMYAPQLKVLGKVLVQALKWAGFVIQMVKVLCRVRETDTEYQSCMSII